MGQGEEDGILCLVPSEEGGSVLGPVNTFWALFILAEDTGQACKAGTGYGSPQHALCSLYFPYKLYIDVKKRGLFGLCFGPPISGIMREEIPSQLPE